MYLLSWRERYLIVSAKYIMSAKCGLKDESRILPSTLVEAWMAVFFAWVKWTRSTPYFLLFTVRFCLWEQNNGAWNGCKVAFASKTFHLRSLLAVVDNNLIVFTAGNKSITSGREVNVVDPIRIFLENFRNFEIPNDLLRQFHFAFYLHSKRGNEQLSKNYILA